MGGRREAGHQHAPGRHRPVAIITGQRPSVRRARKSNTSSGQQNTTYCSRPTRPARGGDPALLPRLRDVGHRRASAARRARRPEAGPPRILWAMLEEGLRPDRPHRKCAGRRRRDEEVPPARRRSRSTTRWCAWRRTSRCATRCRPHGNFGSVDGDPAGRVRATPRRGSARSRWRCSATSTPRRSTSCPNYDGYEQQPARAAQPVPEPAGQRRRRHRGRHGHEHPAAQPRRGDRRGRPLPRRPRGHAGRADEVHQGPRLPDRRPRSWAAGHPRRLRRPAAARSRSARVTDDRGGHERRAARSSSPSCRTR